MSSLNNNILIRVILSVLLGLEIVTAFLISYILYNGVIKSNLYIVITVTLIFFNEYMWMEVKKRGWISCVIALQVFLLVTFPIIFWLNKPQYTFLQAKTEVAQRTDFLNGFMIQDKRHVNIEMYNSTNFFVRYAYLLKVSNENGAENYIIFDPIRGEYKFFE